MKTFEKFNFVDRFFVDRIDRALDDGCPPDRLTTWYVRQRPVLRNYYETMLEMELELRFPGIGEPKTICDTPKVDSISVFRTNYRGVGRIVAAAVTLLVIVTTILFLYNTPQRIDVPAPSVVSNGIGDDKKIDLSDFDAVPMVLRKTVASLDNPFESSLENSFKKPSSGDWSLADGISELKISAEPIANFSERPLETMLAFLERAHVIDVKPVE